MAATGALTLTWKAANPRGTRGTAYVIRRRLPGETAFRFLGVTGEKRFTDETVPAGAERVEYTIQGQRGKRTGPLSEILAVVIGNVEAGEDSRGGAGTRRESRTSEHGGAVRVRNLVPAMNRSVPRNRIALPDANAARIAERV